MKERFDVTGMTCSACSSHVEKSVGKLTGVENVSVNLLTGTQNPGQKRPDSLAVRKTMDFQP